MFTDMKNQLKGKTGKELPKFSAHKGNLSRSSRHGSTSSLGSIVLDSAQPPSLDSNSTSPTQDVHQIKLSDGKVLAAKEIDLLSKKEEQWRSRLEKKENDWTKKIEKREAELIKELSDKENEWKIKERSLTEDLLKQTTELKETLKLTEDYKRKVIEYQEDKDQLESFKTQEMAKVKHLLLAKERENAEMVLSLKEYATTTENLKAEVTRLKPFEEQVANIEEEMETLRHSSEKERASLGRKLLEREDEVRHLEDKVALLAKRSSETDLAMDSTPDSRIQALLGERALLERKYEEAHIHLTDIKASWSAKISALETQVGRLSRQAGEEGAERRSAQEKVTELESKLESVTSELNSLKQTTEAAAATAATTIDSLNTQIASLNNIVETTESARKELEVSRDKLEIELKSSDERISNALEINQTHSEEIDKLKEHLERVQKELQAAREQLEDESNTRGELTLRNAQLSQAVDIERVESSELRRELEAALSRVTMLEATSEINVQELSKKSDLIDLNHKTIHELEAECERVKNQSERCSHLETTVVDLEQQIAERNKQVRVLQQSLADLKKTLQRELKSSGSSSGPLSNDVDTPAMLTVPPNHSTILNHQNTLGPNQQPPSCQADINFQYLKHVIVKFLTSREYEAQHLTKAVATLLQLSPEEELLIKDTLDWKMSWFGSRPKLQDYS